MALRNYMYAKHDSNVRISSKISGQPLPELPMDKATTAQLKALKISDTHCGGDKAASKGNTSKASGNSECKNCADCPRTAHASEADIAQTPVEVEIANITPRTEIKLDYKALDF